MRKLLVVVFIAVAVLITTVGCAGQEVKSITIFCGSASKPAMEEAAQVFEEETGITVYLNFSGSGTMLSQMKISESGDLYIPGSPDYMTMAENDELARKARCHPVTKIEEALEIAFQKCGKPNPTITDMPQASNTFPVLKAKTY